MASLFYTNFRFFGHLIRINQYQKKSTFVTVAFSILRYLMSGFGSNAYIYSFNSPKSPRSKSLLFITPILDYKFFNNFLPYAASIPNTIQVLTFMPLSRNYSQSFTLVRIIKLSTSLNFSFYVSLLFALITLNFRHLVRLRVHILSSCLPRILSYLDPSNTRFFISDPVNPLVSYLASILSKLHITVTVCLNSPHLIKYEYLYYSMFSIVSRFPRHLFYSSPIVELLSPSYHYYSLVNTYPLLTAPSNVLQPDSTRILFVSQPYEQRSCQLKLSSAIYESLMLFSLCLVLACSKNLSFRFLYRPHPRDYCVNLKVITLAVFAFFHPTKFILLSVLDPLIPLLSSTDIAISRDSTVALEYLELSTSPSLYLFSYSFYLSLSEQYGSHVKYLDLFTIYKTFSVK
jgi:hypothetical protein